MTRTFPCNSQTGCGILTENHETRCAPDPVAGNEGAIWYWRCHMRNRIYRFCLLCFLAFCLTACSGTNSPICSAPIEHDTKFGGATIKISIEDFLNLGFEFGDSVDVTFSGGWKIEDVPFYNGYYVRKGTPVLVGYPGDPYIVIRRNSGADLFLTEGIREEETAEITLNTKGKYKMVQETFSQQYSDEREDYQSDAVFCNFREITVSSMKEGLFYRGASPCCNKHNRAAMVSALCGDAGIQTFIDLSDSSEETESYYQDQAPGNDYWKERYQDGSVLPLSMSSDYASEKYRNGVSLAVQRILQEDGPFYIHCLEGKDRTGFMCMLFEAASGASFQELESDYMKTYDNYYGITKEKTPEKYDAISGLYFDDMVLFLTGVEKREEVGTEILIAGARRYFTECGLGDAEIEDFIKKISADSMSADAADTGKGPAVTRD